MFRPRSRTACGLAFTALLTLGSASIAQANLLVNPGFENNGGSYDGWFTFGGGVQLSLPGTDAIIRTGVAASKIYGGFVNCPGTGQFNVGGYGQAFAAPVPGNVYEFSGSTLVSSADVIPGTDPCASNRLIAKIVFFDAAVGGQEISSNELIVGGPQWPLDQWAEFTVSAPAPSGALRVEALMLFLQPACDTGSVFVDDLEFVTAQHAGTNNVLANPSFSPGLADWSTFGNVLLETGRTFVRTTPAAVKMFSTFTPDSPSGLLQSVAVTAGQYWKLAAHAMNSCLDPIGSDNDNFVLARIVYRDAARVETGAFDVVLLDNATPKGTWTQGSVTGQAPANTASADVYILFVSPSVLGGAAWIDDVTFEQVDPTSAPSVPQALGFDLQQNVPNPFNPSTVIGFELQKREHVSLSVFDAAGRRVATLVDGIVEAGVHSIPWTGHTSDGGTAAAGIYRYELRTSSGRAARSMVLVK